MNRETILTDFLSRRWCASCNSRLAARYWDLNDPERAATLQQWRDQASALRLLEIIPSRIRSYTG